MTRLGYVAEQQIIDASSVVPSIRAVGDDMKLGVMFAGEESSTRLPWGMA
ncbi:MAG: hypothetical protein U0132_20795 [Gemmatimonadaceae bacterium]